MGTRGFPNVQGGVERHCEELYPRLVSMGCRVRVYARKGYVGPQTTYYRGVEIFPLWAPRKKSLEAIIHTFLGILHLAFHRKEFDLLHIHAIGPSLLTPVARLLGLKIVVTNQGPDYDRQKWGYTAKAALRFGEFLGTRFASKVIAVSRHIKETLEKRYGREIYFIPNGAAVPNKVSPGPALKKYGLEKGRYILAVGRLVPEKGFHDLLDAFAGIDTDWRLVIAGGADHEDSYSAMIRKKAEKDSRVVATGFISGATLAEVYSNAGFLILPSYHEGLPLTILEAMSYGLPILASGIPANMELVTDKSWTFPPGDIATMRNKLLEFIECPIKNEMILTNTKRIKEEFNWDRIALETLSLYKTAAFCRE